MSGDRDLARSPTSRRSRCSCSTATPSPTSRRSRSSQPEERSAHFLADRAPARLRQHHWIDQVTRSSRRDAAAIGALGSVPLTPASGMQPRGKERAHLDVSAEEGRRPELRRVPRADSRPARSPRATRRPPPVGCLLVERRSRNGRVIALHTRVPPRAVRSARRARCSFTTTRHPVRAWNAPRRGSLVASLHGPRAPSRRRRDRGSPAHQLATPAFELRHGITGAADSMTTTVSAIRRLARREDSSALGEHARRGGRSLRGRSSGSSSSASRGCASPRMDRAPSACKPELHPALAPADDGAPSSSSDREQRRRPASATAPKWRSARRLGRRRS